MTTTLPISANISAFNKLYHVLSKRRTSFTLKCLRPITCYAFSRKKIDSFHENKFKMKDVNELCCYFGVRGEKYGILSRKNERRRVVVVRVNQFGGGGGRDDGNNARILGNLALAIGLTYLSMTGQLGWVLDAIVSVWILAIILPIAGLGAFLWWAGRNIVQSSCPNCGNEFQIFRSSLKDGLQLCPYCTQPFGVEGDEFIKDSSSFTSNQSATFGQAFSGFSPNSKKGKTSSLSVVDIEAEVKDVE